MKSSLFGGVVGKDGKKIRVVKVENPVMEGWLWKQSRFLKTWRKRWFVLQDCKLYSFKKEKVYKDPTEIIDLKVFFSVKSAEDVTGRSNSFVVTSDQEVFALIAGAEEDKDAWIRMIGKVMTMNRSTYIETRKRSES